MQGWILRVATLAEQRKLRLEGRFASSRAQMGAKVFKSMGWQSRLKAKVWAIWADPRA